jgi:hypothetical protein
MLADNDYKFIELIKNTAKQIDPDCTFTLVSIVFSHRLEVKTEKRYKNAIFYKIRDLYKLYNIPLKTSQFIKDRQSVLSFEFKISS